MSISLNEATEVLKDAVTYWGDGTSDTAQLHRAIKAAGLHFCREVPVTVITADVTLSTSDSTLDMTGEVTGWLNTWFIRASINNYDFDKSDDGTVRRPWQAGTPTAGRPTKFSPVAHNDWLFDKPADAGYTLKVTYRAPFTAFTPGTTANPALNIPDEYLYDVLHWGALAYLYKQQSEQHPESGYPTWAAFEKFVAESRAKFGDATAAGLTDRQQES